MAKRMHSMTMALPQRMQDDLRELVVGRNGHDWARAVIGMNDELLHKDNRIAALEADLARVTAERDDCKALAETGKKLLSDMTGLYRQCEAERDALRAGQGAAVRAAVAAERTKVWGDLIRRFNDRDRRRIAGNFAHDWTVTSLTMESRFRADLVETFAATLPKAEALAQLDAEKKARKEQT